jgi:hypothetical protein
MANNMNQPNGSVDIDELKSSVRKSTINIDLGQTLFGVNSNELSILEGGGTLIWKDLFLLGSGLGVPLIINAIVEYSKSSELNVEVFLNFLFGCITVILAVIGAILWKGSSNGYKSTIKSIKRRPKYKM